MNNEKTITISEESVDDIKLAINAISDLAAELYKDVFCYATFQGAIENDKYPDEKEASFVWMIDHYDRIQASVLAISTIARLITDVIPD